MLGYSDAEIGNRPDEWINRVHRDDREQVELAIANHLGSMELKAMDMHTHIDDFGTGYSSLSYLHRFPVDVLKIDRSFIRMLGVREESTEIVKTIITLAQGLSMDVIAEGVEMSEQLSFLQQLRCTYVQGYLFSKPLDSQSAEIFLTHQKENETV
ncbi:MAG: EAL domain-containing protein [bacterium]